jgi:hypothetical protein
MEAKLVVRILGGPAHVASWLSVGQTAVSNWVSENAIPQRHHLKVFKALSAMGFDWDPDAKPSTVTPRTPEATDLLKRVREDLGVDASEAA